MVRWSTQNKYYKLPFFQANETQSKRFIQKLKFFTQGHYKFSILWQTKKLNTLFILKDKNKHPSHTVYIGTCSCNHEYVGETSRNLEARITEHEDISKLSEPARSLIFLPSSLVPLETYCFCPLLVPTPNHWSSTNSQIPSRTWQTNSSLHTLAFTLSLFPLRITWTIACQPINI